MFARVTTSQGSTDQIDKSIRFLREEVIPQAKMMQGFRGLYSLVDRNTGKQLVVALWETEADLNASTEVINRLRAQFVQITSAQPPKVEVYEVAVQP